jgi:pyruvate/oxaloacetate carboxyltransferase
VTNETKNLVRGLYGRTPAEIDPAIRRKIIGDEKPITVRPADLLEPEYDRLAKEVDGLARNEEDVLSYALFPREALEFFKDREMNEKGVNLKDIAAVAVLYMRSTERKPTVDVCAAKTDQWTSVARREQMRQGGWLI